MNKEIAQTLKDAGIRLTDKRKTIFSLLLLAKRPLSYQEIAARKTAASFDKVTIYRTLESLQKAKLLHRIYGVDGIWRFCVNNSNHVNDKICAGDHIHFLCSKCNKMICLPQQNLPWVSVPEGATIYSKQFLVHGVCASCNSKIKQ